MTRPMDPRRRQRWQGLDNKSEGSTTTTEVLVEEDEHRVFNNDNGCVDGGYMTCIRNHRQRWRRQRLDDRPNELETTTEC